MRGFMKKLDKYCYDHPRFGIPNLMLYIVIANAAVWLFSAMDTTGLLRTSLMFSAEKLLQGQIWRLVTFILVPEQSGFLLLIFLYFYYFIGSSLEREWGAGQFLVYYLLGMALTVVFGLLSYFITGFDFGMTASYINLSMFFAFATLFPETYVMLFFIIPVKIKWLGIANALFFVYEIFSRLGAGYGMMAFLPLVAVLNYFLFCAADLFALIRPLSKDDRQKTVSFKREVAKIKYEQKTKPYTRKCSVCGRTDADFPDLEFRYCSRCEGYHCFCQDHINSHVHFTE